MATDKCDEMVRIVAPLCESLEECAIQLTNNHLQRMMMNQVIWSKSTRQIHEFQWINVKFRSIGNFEDDYQARKGNLRYEIDKGMFCLVANKKSNPKKLFEALQEIIKIENNNKNNNNR
ncbi:hypothetical protein Glove_230g105 [Diversispora epigaea]|uniref:Uncharacterized protein n=1 Tax=Diversispora epigaea TaxID=1348612 RepID=A0A397IKL4_9GLOM|nr:hypothetical protein Glove_230g105 [Diversispora epigaea]